MSSQAQNAAMQGLPVIDLDIFLSQPHGSDGVIQECRKVSTATLPITLTLPDCFITDPTHQAADALIVYGALLLRDSRVSEEDNSTFLDLLEDYFDQPIEDQKKDERPELSYQVGVTLENTEKPKCAADEPCLRIIERLDPAERPLDISAHSPDPKCRFFWKMREAPPYTTQYPVLNAPNIVPEAEHLRSRWPTIMEKWGKSMKDA